MAKRKTKTVTAQGENNVCKGADLSGYVKTKAASGNTSLDCADDVAKQLRGKELDAIYKLAAKTLGETEKALRARYGRLNVGMQRMNLGNRLRRARQPCVGQAQSILICARFRKVHQPSAAHLRQAIGESDRRRGRAGVFQRRGAAHAARVP